MTDLLFLQFILNNTPLTVDQRNRVNESIARIHALLLKAEKADK